MASRQFSLRSRKIGDRQVPRFAQVVKPPPDATPDLMIVVGGRIASTRPIGGRGAPGA